MRTCVLRLSVEQSASGLHCRPIFSRNGALENDMCVMSALIQRIQIEHDTAVECDLLSTLVIRVVVDHL